MVTYTDVTYFERAKNTIEDIRIRGQFFGDLIVMTDGLFKIDPRFIIRMNLIVKEYPDVDVSELLEKIHQHPFRDSDGRELHKTKQWNKLYVFDVFFKQWDFVFFVDAGLRIFNRVDYFYPKIHENAIVALDDGHPEFTKKFDSQIELSNTKIVEKLKLIYDIHSSYFLNCLFIFDTQLIQENTLWNLIELINEYPICKTNEMAIMNIYFHKNWIPLEIYLGHDLILFDWCERDERNWDKYVALKYTLTYKN